MGKKIPPRGGVIIPEGFIIVFQAPQRGYPTMLPKTTSRCIVFARIFNQGESHWFSKMKGSPLWETIFPPGGVLIPEGFPTYRVGYEKNEGLASVGKSLSPRGVLIPKSVSNLQSGL